MDWIWLRPKFNVSVLIRDTQESDTETQRRSCDIRSGDRSSAVRSQGTQRRESNGWKPGRGEEGFSPTAFRGSTALLAA